MQFMLMINEDESAYGGPDGAKLLEATLAGHMKLAEDLVAAGKVRPAITERVSLAGAADAIARMANRQVKGKVVILPGA